MVIAITKAAPAAIEIANTYDISGAFTKSINAVRTANMIKKQIAIMEATGLHLFQISDSRSMEPNA